MIDPCECCSVPVDKIWIAPNCLGCRFNEQNWKRPSINPCHDCAMDAVGSCDDCPVRTSPDDIFANDLKQMSWEDYLADMAKEREELINE